MAFIQNAVSSAISDLSLKTLEVTGVTQITSALILTVYSLSVSIHFPSLRTLPPHSVCLSLWSRIYVSYITTIGVSKRVGSECMFLLQHVID